MNLSMTKRTLFQASTQNEFLHLDLVCCLFHKVNSFISDWIHLYLYSANKIGVIEFVI